MKDFRCCDLTLPTMHDLQRHYEERHSQEMPQSYNKKADQSPQPDSKAALANGAATAVKEQALKDEKQKTPQPSGPPTATQSPTIPTPTQIIPQRRRRASSDFAPPEFPLNQDMDPLHDLDMEMDEPVRPPQQQTLLNAHQLPRLAQAPRLGQPSHDRTPSLNLDQLRIGIPLQHHQGLRTSTPTTPIGRGGPVFQHNPTVSSVNTPTLTAFPTHQQAHYIPTPDSSAPGTPGELDAPFGAMSMNTGYMPGQPTQGGYYPWGNGHEMLDLCIDEPAKRLYSLNGLKPPKSSALQPPSRLGDNQYSENSEVAKTIREQQRIAGVPEPPNDGVPKPFHCPVIGCEKAYKNQNGLKYHKAVRISSPFHLCYSLFVFTALGLTLYHQHGHNTQQLAANSNGTFSIVDPDTHEVYPGTMGMEKHKPYRCGTCGKRYKNLNGLKYHKNHSPTCDPNDDPQGSRPTSRPTSSGSAAVGQAGFGNGIGGAPTTFTNNMQSNLGIPGAVGGI